jgi:hypothetical protein
MPDSSPSPKSCSLVRVAAPGAGAVDAAGRSCDAGRSAEAKPPLAAAAAADADAAPPDNMRGEAGPGAGADDVTVGGLLPKPRLLARPAPPSSNLPGLLRGASLAVRVVGPTRSDPESES